MYFFNQYFASKLLFLYYCYYYVTIFILVIKLYYLIILCFIGNFRELSEIISKSTDVLIKNGQHLDNVLETLNLQEHSLGILAVLCVKFSLPNPNGSNNADAYKPLFSQVQEFIIGCNGEQVRFASDICKIYIFSLFFYKY